MTMKKKAAKRLHKEVDCDLSRRPNKRPAEIDFSRFIYCIADDHPSVSLAVSQLLSEVVGIDPSNFMVVMESTDLLSFFSGPSPRNRVVILDLVMPGDLKRASLVNEILRVDPLARILAYTADESAFLAKAVIDSGALGYVAKTSPANELMKAIVTVCAGQRHIDCRINLESIKTHPWLFLTESERAVLVEFCRGRKASEIVANTGRSYSTVMTHKYNGLNKLGLRDGAELLPYIYMNGLLHELD